MICAHCGEEVVRGHEFVDLPAAAWRHEDGRLFCWVDGCHCATPYYESVRV